MTLELDQEETYRVTSSTPRSVHIVDATRGPLVGEGRVDRIMPFAATATISLIVTLPLASWTRPVLAVVGSGLVAATIIGSAVIPWPQIARTAQVVSPLLFLAATLLLIAATGQGIGAPFIAMVALPLMWLALYENRAAVIAAAILAGVALWLAALSATAESSYEGALTIFVLVICSAGMGVTLHGLVGDARRLAIELREHQLASEHLSLHDSLTDLSNRRGFAAESRLARDRAERDGLPFSLVYIDLDNFKGLNDTLGHDAGDLLLREVADRLRSLVRAGDTIARLGGDEFAVIVEGSDPAHSIQLADRIEAALKLPYVVGDEIPVSASVGIAHSADVGTDPEAVLSAADISMFDHKREGHRSRQAAAGISPTGRPSGWGARNLERSRRGSSGQ
ncbi:MAG: GGDEF domain-containing protein [Ilumatobacteraceae bacterium]